MPLPDVAPPLSAVPAPLSGTSLTQSKIRHPFPKVTVPIIAEIIDSPEGMEEPEITVSFIVRLFPAFTKRQACAFPLAIVPPPEMETEPSTDTAPVKVSVVPALMISSPSGKEPASQMVFSLIVPQAGLLFGISSSSKECNV